MATSNDIGTLIVLQYQRKDLKMMTYMSALIWNYQNVGDILLQRGIVLVAGL